MAYFIGYTTPYEVDPEWKWEGYDKDELDFDPEVLDPERVARFRYGGGNFLERGLPVQFNNFRPKCIWGNKNLKPLDNNSVNLQFVSRRLKDLIEEFEPGVHQFLPVPVYHRKAKEPFDDHYILNICNLLSAVDHDRTNWNFLGNKEKKLGFYSEGGVGKDASLVFNSRKIGEAKLWRDTNIIGFQPICSDDLGRAMQDASLTGVSFREIQQA